MELVKVRRICARWQSKGNWHHSESRDQSQGHTDFLHFQVSINWAQLVTCCLDSLMHREVLNSRAPEFCFSTVLPQMLPELNALPFLSLAWCICWLGVTSLPQQDHLRTATVVISKLPDNALQGGETLFEFPGLNFSEARRIFIKITRSFCFLLENKCKFTDDKDGI